jgi:hypothetical protein
VLSVHQPTADTKLKGGQRSDDHKRALDPG